MRIFRSVAFAIGALLVLAPAVLGDECCFGHDGVVATPPIAMPGSVVTFDNIDCTGIGQPALTLRSLRRYFLAGVGIFDWDDTRPDPDTWHLFKEIVGPDETTGSVRIVVPDDVQPGWTFLWWSCETGPDGAVAEHSTNDAVLVIKATPASDTAPAIGVSGPRGLDPAVPPIVGGAAGLLAVLGLRRRARR